MNKVLKDLLDASNTVDEKDIVGDVEEQTEVVEDTKEPEEPKEVAEKVETPEEPKEEKTDERKDIPFHKHPRWIAKMNKEKEMEATIATLQEQLGKIQQPQVQPEKPQMNPEFVKLFGENEEAWQTWKNMRAAERKEIMEEVRAEYARIADQERQQRLEQEKAQQQALAVVEDRFLALEEETGVAFTDRENTQRNRILDICDKYKFFEKMPPEDALEAGLNIYKEFIEQQEASKATQQIEERRKVATKTNIKTNSNVKENEFFTPAKIRAIEKAGGYRFLES